MRISKRNAMKIVTEISEVIPQHINIMDEQGAIIASTDQTRIGQIHEGARKIITEKIDRLIISRTDEFSDARAGVNLPILCEGDIVGVVGITGEPENTVKYGQIIKKMTEVLILDGYIKQQREAVRCMKLQYLSDWILDDTVTVDDRFAELGQRYDLDIRVPRRVLAIRVVCRAEKNDALETQRCVKYAEQQIETAANQVMHSVVFRHISTILCAVPFRSNEQLLAFAEQLKQQIEAVCPVHLLIGIDGGAHGYGALGSAYRDASAALKICALHPGGGIQLYDESNLAILLSEVPQRCKRDFTRKVLGSLPKKELPEAARLLRTLYCVNGSIAQAAANLFVHKNTLQYKLRRIAQQTGFDPRQLRNAALFQTALLLLEETGDEGWCGAP